MIYIILFNFSFTGTLKFVFAQIIVIKGTNNNGKLLFVYEIFYYTWIIF